MKAPDERGPLSAWVVAARAKLDPLTAEDVAEAVHIHISQVRKLEAGGPAYKPSRRLQREVPALLMRLARERGVVLDPPPVPMEKDSPDTDVGALVAAIEAQTRAISDLAMAIREDRDRISADGLAMFLQQLRAEGLLVEPSQLDRPPSSDVPQRAGAGR